MSRKYLVCVLLILFSLGWGSIKSQSLMVDESGRFQMVEVVPSDGFTKEALYRNSLGWIKTLKGMDKTISYLSVDSVLCKISGQYEFLVYMQGGILKKKAGAISCVISLEMKDNKYRYAFTDFLYHYLVQDRNYEMIKNGKTKPLEDTEAPGWQKLWNNHRKTAAREVKKRSEELKEVMIAVPNLVKENPKPEIEW